MEDIEYLTKILIVIMTQQLIHFRGDFISVQTPNFQPNRCHDVALFACFFFGEDTRVSNSLV